MKHFTPTEFQGWFYKLSPVLKAKLDALREELGAPVHLSKAEGSIGRRLGLDSLTQHNFDRWGEVRAVDGYLPEGVTYLEFYNVAKEVGFTGIGLYDGWSGGRGFHVDVREDRDEGSPAIWGGTYIYDPVTKKGKTTYGSIWEIIGLETVIG
jgi:hypothetical protein